MSRSVSSLPLRKRAAHRLKAALYYHPRLDAWLDERFGGDRPPASGLRALLHRKAYLRLLPERHLRGSPLATAASATPAHRGSVRLLTLVPPEDTGGGSRPAQIAAELRRRGFAIDWAWTLPIFPWPAARRPPVPGVLVRHVAGPAQCPPEAPPAGGAPRLVLLEAPHPALLAEARSVVSTAPVVYDAIDLWQGTLGAGWYDRAVEKEAIAAADHLVASSRLLRDEIARRSGRPVELLANAYDPARFDPAVERAAPADVRRGTPSVAYVGALWGEWVDLGLVAQLAEALPSAEIHLIGPMGDRDVPRARNLHALGAKPQEEIPAYLAAVDVTIVPFTASRLAAAVSPLKVFEYLAMRRPVVATALPELATVPGVRIAHGADEFVAAVAQAARLPFPTAQVAHFLAGQTWAARVDHLLALAGVA